MMLGRRREREDSAAHAASLETELDAVAAERDRLLAAVDAVSEAVVIADASGTVVHRSAAAARFEEARHGDAVAADLLDRLLARACTGEPGNEELTLHGPPRRVLAVRAEPLTVDGEVIGAIGTVGDVTELHYVRDVRRDFVANVSHELKTPIGALALLAETFAATDHPETAKRLSDQILRETDRLVRIVDDLLDLSLIEAQEAPIREHVPLHMLLGEAVERVRALALAQGMPLRYQEPQHDLTIECDPTKLLGAITNLLDNAVKYSEEGGTIELFTEHLRGRVVVVVRDHGIGIPSRDLERIFERFYRVDKARSRVTGGTGLGLSIVRHVAQAHGGDVSVESTEGEGSTFRLALPIAGPLDAQAPAQAEAF
jgi:two-component system sensor histidine kinase SenX3